MSTSKMPQRLFEASEKNATLESLHMNLDNNEYSDYKDMFFPGQNWLLGFAIPPFQRDLAWSREQEIKFVESAWLGFHLGTYVFNNAMDAPMAKVRPDDKEKRYHKTDRWLIDGQQRLTALDHYWRNEFKVFGHYWDDLERIERRRFLNSSFGCAELKIYDEHQLRVLYDRLNFGGTPHQEHERALPHEEDGSPGMRR